MDKDSGIDIDDLLAVDDLNYYEIRSRAISER